MFFEHLFADSVIFMLLVVVYLHKLCDRIKDVTMKLPLLLVCQLVIQLVIRCKRIL